MANKRVRVLCAGDIHIGRRPSRLPDHVDGRRHAAAEAWKDIVDYAISQDIDAVVLTGDIVDRSNRYFEALGPLEEGLQRLETADIDIFAVAGNHDFDVLPRLVDDLDFDGFHLLGRGGQWTQETLTVDGEQALELVGWSYPSEHVSKNPVDEFDLDLSGSTPTIGLLHTEIGEEGSRFAPTTIADLDAKSSDAWILGHIHKPGSVGNGSSVPILYPGSPQPLDPSEVEAHGPWLVAIDEDGVEARQVPLASVRYEDLDIDLSDVGSSEDFEATVPQVMRDILQERLEEGPNLEHCICRLRFTGRTPLHGDIRVLARRLAADLTLPIDEASATVDTFDVDTLPDFELEKVAQMDDPPGLVAQLLLALEADDLSEYHKQIISDAETKLDEVYRANAFSALRSEDSPPGKDQVQEVLRQQGMNLLDELMKQKQRGETG